MTIDFRSDTITQPTPAMREAMMHTAVGDDVFGEDPSVNALQSFAAKMFGMEAALFCPSGTMTNQIAIKAHTQPGDEVICEASSHVYQYEGGGIAFHSGASVKLLQGNRGRITAEQIVSGINPDDEHKPITRLVSLENTCNRGGGSCYNYEGLKKIRAVCDANHLMLHLDGARLFNALIAKGETPEQYGKIFHSISLCLSKGLGAPVGSLLLGNAAFIKKAHRLRKLFGGGMRQAGFLAAAGHYALQHHVERLKEDHGKAKALENVLKNLSYVKEVLPVETNIIIFQLKEPYTAARFAERLKEHHILAYDISPMHMRLVTHLDITDAMLEKSMSILKSL